MTPEQTTADAQDFLNGNKTALPYTLGNPETYPGYYKFHTTDDQGKPGLDLMVNGFNGKVWMNTYLGLPVAKD